MRPHRHTGAVAVEFALVLGIFLFLLFGTLEVARVFYVFNILQEVTRRAAVAAAKADFSNASALQQIRQHAVFRSSPGPMALAAPLSDQSIVIDYLSISKASDGTLSLAPMPALPASPMARRQACMSDPYGASCIQFVRVRVCATADSQSCQPVALTPMASFLNFAVNLPTAVTIVKADSLGLSD